VGAYNALMDGYVTSPDPGPPPTDSNGGATAGASVGPHPSQMGPHISALQGMPPLNGAHNIPLHVGVLGILALALVIVIRLLGFRFSAVGKIGAGVGVGRG
jgi:hypothetical protein